MALELDQLVRDVAACIERVDARRPQAANARTGALYQPGIGPHTETAAVALIAEDLVALSPERYAGRVSLGVHYQGGSREKCDLCIGTPPSWEWAVEMSPGAAMPCIIAPRSKLDPFYDTSRGALATTDGLGAKDDRSTR